MLLKAINGPLVYTHKDLSLSTILEKGISHVNRSVALTRNQYSLAPAQQIQARQVLFRWPESA